MFREKALAVLRTHNKYGAPLENHCIRLAKFAVALSGKAALDVDEDLLFAGAYLHDIGLLVPNDSSKNYLVRGAVFAAPLFDEWGFSDVQKQQMNDMLLFNHSASAPATITPAGELIRRGVQVEHSIGRWTHGLDKDVIKHIFASHPRRGLNAVLLDFAKISVQRDGVRALYQLFFPGTGEGRP